MSHDKIVGDGIHDDAAGIQAALDSGAGLVYLPKPPGRYLIGRTLRIHSGQTLRLDRHAIIQLNDQANDEMLSNADPERGDRDIRIEGGIWDGNNLRQTRGNTDIPAFNPELFTGSVIRLKNVRHLEIRDVTIKDPESFGIQIGNICGFTIENITFDYNMARLNMDGVHLNGPCRQGRITNLQGATNDDLLALNADDGAWGEMTRGPIEDIAVDYVCCTGGYTAVRLLSAGSPVRRIRLANIFGTYRYYGVSFTHHEVHPGAPTRFEDIALDGIFCAKCPDAVQTPIIWVQDQAQVTDLSIRDYHRTETAMNMDDLRIEAGATVEYLSLNGFTSINRTRGPLTVVMNKGAIGSLSLIDVLARGQNTDAGVSVLDNQGTIERQQLVNVTAEIR